MDEFKLRKGIQALQWEANYRKKDAADQSVANQFLTAQASLDEDFRKHLEPLRSPGCKLLDIGTGGGEQSIFMAEMGFDVTATDVSASAIENAKKLAIQRKSKITFLVDNILSSSLTHQYDIITDRGCFTLIPARFKPTYVNVVAELLKTNGWMLIKADKKKADAIKWFREHPAFIVHSLEESCYESLNGKLVKALVLVMQKIS